jgi:hypothetical protein
MAIPSQRKWLFISIAALILLAVAAALLLSQPGHELNFTAGPGGSQPTSGFTFLDLGADSVLDRTLRRRLEDHLGSDAIAFRTPVDLRFTFRDLLPGQWPHLAALDNQLNPPLGERREHNTIKLMYRRAGQRNPALEYVELLFSNFDGRPLIHYVKAGTPGIDILAELEKKYGPPEDLPAKAGISRAYGWRRGDDLLVAINAADKAGRPTYHFIFYFVDNLRTLVARELAEEEARRQERREAGRQVF